MIRIPYEEIVAKIMEKKGISESELNAKIKEKRDSLSGLITDQGAAQIIASEMGVNLYEEYTKPLKIKKLFPGLRNLKTAGKVTRKYDVKGFTTKDGREGKVGSFILGDETGTIRLTLWNDMTDILNNLKEGDVVQINDAMCKQGLNNPELQIFSRDAIAINPEGVDVGNVQVQTFEKRQYPEAKRMKISEITDSMDNIEILGNIVAVYDPKFFEVCPQCNKRVREEGEGFMCPEHGQVEPKLSYVANATIDDGSGSIRTAFFQKQLDQLIKESGNSMEYYKDKLNEFQNVKDNLLGEFIKVLGKSIRSEAFDRVEFRAQLVFLKPDPEEEIKKIQE